LSVFNVKLRKPYLQDGSTQSSNLTKIGLSLLQLSPSNSTLQFITKHRQKCLVEHQMKRMIKCNEL